MFKKGDKVRDTLVGVLALISVSWVVGATELEGRVRRLEIIQEQIEATQPRNYYYPDQIWKRKRESYNHSIKGRQDSSVPTYSQPLPSVRYGRSD